MIEPRTTTIRRLYAQGQTYAEIAAAYGISPQRVEQLVKGRKASATARPTSVYLALVGEYVKIGVAIDVQNRLKHLQSQCPYPVVCLAIMPGTRADEAKLHAQWQHLRTHNEWFTATVELLQFAHDVADIVALQNPA